MFEPINAETDKRHRTAESGILTYAFGLEYQRQAFLQARTAKSVLGLPMTVVVDHLHLKELEDVANVLVLPGIWKQFEYETTALDLTPYAITFKTDADMLWPAGSALYHAPHLPFTSGVATDVMGRITNVTAYRETEIALGLPTVYSACFSFDKRRDEAVAFFDHLKYLFEHWYALRIWDFLPDDRPKLKPTTDTAYSMAHLHVMGAARIDGNRFIHCKPYINSWTKEQWTQFKRFQVDNKLNMHLDGVRLSQGFHYFDKSLIDDALTKRLSHVCSLQEDR